MSFPRLNFSQFSRSSCGSRDQLRHAVCHLELNQLILHWSLRARFQQLLDFGISAASGWHSGRGARLLFLPPEENRDSELLQLVTWFCQVRFVGRKTWFVRFGIVIAFVLVWKERARTHDESL